MRELATRARKTSRAQRPLVLTVTSGKGGVGKSTVSLNLALALAGQGVRVLLFDADANLAGLDILLGIAPRFRLSNVLRGEREIEEILIRPHSHLMVLPGSSGEVDYPLLTVERQRQLLEDLRSLNEPYDLLLIDTAAGLSPEIVTFAVEADEVLVVTTPEPTAVIDAYAMIKVIVGARSDAQIRLLVNGARRPQDADDAAQKLALAVAHFLRRELKCAGVVPFDDAVATAVLRQQPLMQSAPHSGAALSLGAVARTIAAELIHSTEGRAVAV
jgi:flagellar biosynthesis protein FlhG